MNSITDLKSNTAYTLDSLQAIDEGDRSRIELYADHAVKVAVAILALGMKYLAADAYYSKVKFVSAIIPTGLSIVGSCE
ncbi:hypothetical protein [uncultured Microbulbifer sp.]|uniref:hypothetical protein n=1 Tax=uncultured Microbulbifer sp. TaxID=348147 RepID=UPI00262FB63C|nr:hypothetical protein [uncultured Microbulbifer sp.]